MSTPTHNNWLSTNSGKIIDLNNPDPDQITIEDIAANLSKICRFNGQIKQFYSVAQHSLYTSLLVPDNLKLEALLHDASEAYICDVPTPLKRMLGDIYRDVEARLMRAIGITFNVNLESLHPTVKAADRIMLVSERDFLQAKPQYWGPEYESSLRYPNFNPPTAPFKHVYDEFLARFYDYSRLDRTGD